MRGIIFHARFLIFQVDRVYLRSPNCVAVLDHERKRTYILKKEGLPDVGKTPLMGQNFHILEQLKMPK